MALVWGDRVLEQSTSTGTGDFTLSGAVVSYQTFGAVCATDDTIYYTIIAVDANGNPSGDWESGLGTYSASNTLTRTTVSASSNAGAAVNFAAGTKQVLASPTAAYMALVVAEEAGEADPNFSEVQLLVSGDGTDGGTTFTDESNTARTLTRGGAAETDTGISKFGGGSILFGTGTDYVQAASSADFNLNGEFTVEAWVYAATLGSGWEGIVGRDVAFHLYVNSSVVKFRFERASGGATTVEATTDPITTGTWYHIAADRDAAGDIRIYIDGTMVKKQTGLSGAMVSSTSPVRIGHFVSGFPGSNGTDFNGNLEEVRVTNGAARYASDAGFTPPAAAFPRS